ncbi:hypothetical protein NKH77_47355 [Streptomyces sp. M19]
MRDVVRANLAGGADLIKVMATGGNLTPGGPAPAEAQFDVAELTVAVKEAHAAGRRVAAHVHGAAGIEAALAAGWTPWSTARSSPPRAPGGPGGPGGPDRPDRGGGHVRVPDLQRFAGPGRAQHRGRGAAAVAGCGGVAARAGVRLIAGTDAGIPARASTSTRWACAGSCGPGCRWRPCWRWPPRGRPRRWGSRTVREAGAGP